MFKQLHDLGEYLELLCWKVSGPNELEVTRKERRHVSLTTAACLGTGIWHRTTPDFIKLMTKHSKISGCVQSLGRVQRHFQLRLQSNSVQHICQRCDNGHLWITYELVLGTGQTIPFQPSDNPKVGVWLHLNTHPNQAIMEILQKQPWPYTWNAWSCF